MADKFENLDISQAPYYDTNLNNDYTQVLFRPGTPLQNRDLNEIQSTSKRIVKGVADCFLKDGDIKSGAQIIIESIEGSIEKDITITDGKIYINGIVRDFKSQKVRIKGKGLESVGVRLSTKAVKYTDDNRLVSPASGLPAFGLPSSDRLEETLILTANDDKATAIYLLQDGELVTNNKKEDDTMYNKLLALLARRTFDESGHYKVRGLELSQKAQQDENNLYLNLSIGKAYVNGWEIEKQTATTIPIPRAKATRSIVAEPKIYQSGNKKYALNNNPVSKIDRLISVIKVSTRLTRQGSVNGTDPIPSQYTPVAEVLSIKQSNTSTNYTKNVDYVLESDTIRWLNGGKQPDLGSTYEIEFNYNKTMIPSKDYKLTVDNGQYYVELLNGDTPVERSQMLIDYTFYLHYIASITLDEKGILRAVPGQSDTEDKIAPPDITDQAVLLLGYVHVAPVNDTLKIRNSRNIRSDMDRIQKMFERIEDMEVNQAITDLDKEALEGEDATQLKGIFTDGFLGFTKSDINHPKYNASIDVANNELTLGYKLNTNKLSIDKDNSKNYSAYNRIVTALGEEKAGDKQPFATRAHRINPYTVFPQTPSIDIYPRVDNWIETNNITLRENGGTTVSYNSIRDGNNSSPNREARRWYEWRQSGTTSSTTSSSYTTTDTSTKVTDSAIEYMRPIEIKVTGSRFFPRQDNIRVIFNDIPVDVTPESSTYKGSNGSLMADTNGVVKGKFTIPNNVRCGTVNVKIYAEEFPKLVGDTPFIANGTLKTTTTTYTTRTHTTYTTVYSTKWTEVYVDPVAQTFSVLTDQMLTSIGLYFASKDNKHDLRVQIRKCDNGYPSEEILSETVVGYNDIKISNDSSVQTLIKFDDPIYLKANEQYAVTVLSNSPTASIYVQELGKKDLITNKIVLENPYVPGMMFESSNAIAWSAKQDFNLKFDLYINDYTRKSTIYFNSIKGVEYDGIKLLADTSVPLDCTLKWEYSIDESKTWLPLAIENHVDLLKKINNVTVRAKMTTKGNVSPAIALDSLLLLGTLNSPSSTYVSRNIVTDAKYTSVKVIADVYAPSGAGVVFYYATDRDGNTWKKLTQNGDGKVKKVGGYIEYTYTANESSGVNNFRVRVDLTTNNPAVRPTVRRLKCIVK
ncbi:DUF4815 domain-containing protein [Peptoniphilus sp. MSJ-1]|uniref:DUF4815 domain-containing protein n=1 Tax=Peptoniphilus ovalis TaxID=2841503 RepID=A0ABS6FHI4_9FIRM|nr:DUF4815 domain-containing protein [Peptoniphilus ovalis]MBU5669498.1 DUF4815 domain-containing protein [Peptoniphilus ovalis]